ncbi:MAG: Jag N-terminal domain-containing protein [Chloroflexota bacterium]|nr:Jag N-terminal domain-containing protein [Chloroflexota bacterium]
MTFREFTGKNVEEAIRSAMKEFSSDLGDLDIEILAQGSRGILGVGGEEARILAAPKSAVAAAETVRVEPEASPTSPEPPSVQSEPSEPLEVAPQTGGLAPSLMPQDDAGDQAIELAQAEESRRRRGGRGRGGRPTNGRERPRERAERPERADRPDRPMREPAPFIPAKPLEELSENERGALEEAKGVLEEMLRLMSVPATVEILMGSETSKLNVRGEDLGVLIGRRGEKLASLQHLVNLIVAKREGQHLRIAVDVENYRGRREDQLRDVADRAAKRVAQSGKIIQLEAMPALERRIVHLALIENPNVRTQSVGVEPNRRIVVLPATRVEQ